MAILAAVLVVAVPAAAQKKAAAPKKPRALDPATTNAILKTSQGDVTIRFFPDKAPNHVKTFLDLCSSGFYDGTLFHRVVPGFVLQGGDPLTKDPNKRPFWGTGERLDRKLVPVRLSHEFNSTTHRRGVVSMARMQSDPNSASSQFFIVLKDSPFLDNQYTAFGEVVAGMDVVDKLVTESNSDTSDPRTLGTPRSYQKLQKVQLVEAAAGASP